MRKMGLIVSLCLLMCNLLTVCCVEVGAGLVG